MALPQIVATGNLTRDPEIRFTQNNKVVASFSVACNKKRKNDATGEWEDAATCFLSCTVWDRDAEAVAERLVKGSQVTVVGALKQRKYTDKDGVERTVYDVDVYSVAEIVRSKPAEREKPADKPAEPVDPWATDTATPF